MSRSTEELELAVLILVDSAFNSLLSQFTITGFDASAHMSEETHDAARAAPLGVLTAVGASSLFGFFLLCSYLFCIQDFDRTVNTELGQPVIQVSVT